MRETQRETWKMRHLESEKDVTEMREKQRETGTDRKTESREKSRTW